PKVALGETLAVHRIQELKDADHPALSEQRHGQNGPGLERSRRIAVPARIGGYLVDHLGLARQGDVADDPLPQRQAHAADRPRRPPADYAEEKVPPLLV